MTGKLIKLDHTGHSVTEWNTDVEPSVTAAREEYERIVASGQSLTYTPVKDKPGKFEQIREFDPTAEEILVSPRLVGG